MKPITDDLCDENQLAKIAAAEAAGLTLFEELVASLRKVIIQNRYARPVGWLLRRSL